MPASPKFHGEWIGGMTELTLPIILRNTSDNREATGVAHGDITAYYWRETKSPVAIPAVALASVTAFHTAGGWYEVSSTHFPGLYRLDVPDAAIDDEDGVNFVNICVQSSGCYAYYRTLTIETWSRSQIWADLNNSACGLQKLVRATNPLNTLNVNTSGYAEVDLKNWKGATPLDLTLDWEVQAEASSHGSTALGELESEIENSLATTPRIEPAAGAPPDSPTVVEMIQYLYMGLKNKLSSTNNTLKLHNKDGAELTQSTLSDDGTTFTRSKFVAP